MKHNYFFSLAAIVLLLAACGGQGKDGNHVKDSSNNKQTEAKKYDRKFNDYARYMAGLPVAKGSGLEGDDSISYVKLHVKDFDARWKEMDEKRLSKMRDWAKSELYPKIDENLNLYYPFSGADFLHANQFFPNAKKSLYCALEPVGEVPDLAKMTSAERIVLLKSIDKALTDIFKRSYFITSYMGRDVFAIGHVPLFMVFMSRCGYDVLNVEMLDMDASGKCSIRTGKANGISGVRFTYCPTGKESDVRTLEYFSANVEDNNAAKTGQFTKYVKDFGKANVYFKAASYIMHWNTFDKFREASLSISAGILQDDTGYPFRAVKDNYSAYYYGTYVPAIKDFHGYFQPEMAAAFNASGSNRKDLPFSLGYHWVDKQQNLMIFVKK